MSGAIRQRIPSRFLTLGKLALLSGILFTIFLVSMIIGMRYSIRGKVLETPPVVGMRLDDARDLFSGLELNLVVSGRRYDASLSEGTIVSQWPGAGLGIKANRDVQVVVSLGRRTNPVPDLAERSFRAAKLMAEQRGYSIGRVSRIPAREQDDLVLGQWPRGDSESEASNRIDLLVGREEGEAYVMPRLIGLNLNSALGMLGEDLFETDVRYREHPGISRGTVVRQFPEPGYRVVKGETVNLEVAR